MNTLITQDRLDAIKRIAKYSPKGSIAEVGVYKGGSLKVLAELFPDRKVYGFDTFEGLPQEQWNDKEFHTPGEFNDTSLEAVTTFISKSNVRLIKGLFPDTANPFEKEKFALVHIDTDFYLSVKECINWFWPRMVKGGTIIFDDYDWPNCQGVKKAVDEFMLPIQTADFQAAVIKQ